MGDSGLRGGSPLVPFIFHRLVFFLELVELTAYLSIFDQVEKSGKKEAEGERGDDDQKKRKLGSIPQKSQLYGLDVVDRKYEQEHQNDDGKKNSHLFHGCLPEKDFNRIS